MSKSQKTDILHFDVFLLFRWYEVSAKKVQRVISLDSEEWCKV